MELMSEKEYRLLKIFDPDAARKRLGLRENEGKLVHYTSADTALKILRSKEVWMRNVRCMNDFTGVEHGFSLLRRFFADPTSDAPDIGRGELIAAMDEIEPGSAKKMLENFSGWMPAITSDSYITCISEHHKKEDQNGRLSMWRSYGMGAVGVGIVVNPAPFYSLSDALKAYSRPVSYETSDEFFERLRSTADRIRAEHEFLKNLPPDEVAGCFFDMLLSSSLCSKHPGFEEEQEWRVMHIPLMWPSTALTRSTEVIGGVPQSVYKIPLKDMPTQGLEGIEIPTLIDHIIIGPCNNPLVVYQAFVAELTALGMKDAPAKIVPSQIPLRN